MTRKPHTVTPVIPGARYVHTNLIARDWRVLTSFYESVFGCERVPPERDYSGPEVAALTSVPGAALRGVHLRLPGLNENGPTLEIFEYSPVEPGLAPAVNRPGFAHIAFVVDSVEDARRGVLTAGGTAVGEIAVFTTATGARVAACYVTDPEGNIIELQSWDEDAGDGRAQTEAASQPELTDGRHGASSSSVGAGSAGRQGSFGRGDDMRFENAGSHPKPERVTLERGTYFFCRCGKTQNPPYCDGRHARTGITPLRFLTDGETEIRLCTCGLTSTPPHCDGSHVNF